MAFYTVNGGGHRLPSIAHGDFFNPEENGPQNRDIEHTAEIWNFLENHTLPEPSSVTLGLAALYALAGLARRRQSAHEL